MVKASYRTELIDNMESALAEWRDAYDMSLNRWRSLAQCSSVG